MSLASVRTALAQAQGGMQAVQEFTPKGVFAGRIADMCGEALKTVDATSQRIDELETALNRLVLAHENTQADSDGRWPRPDCGCIYCTQGTVPDKLNTGPCAYHKAKQLLGQL